MSSRNLNVDFLPEEHRAKDLEIPLFELEQRFEKLENQFQTMKVDLSDRLSNSVAQKINLALPTYLPRVSQAINQMKEFRERTELFIMQQREKNGDQSEEKKDEQQQLKFQINNFTAEIQYIKTLFTPTKLSQIEAADNAIRNLNYEVEVIKMNMEKFATLGHLEITKQMFKEYATKIQMDEIRDDIADFVKQDQFNVVEQDQVFLKKDLARLCTKDELMTRLNVFSVDVNTKIADRPTINYFKKVLSAYDSKIDMVNTQMALQMELLDNTQADQDKEIEALGHELNKRNRELALKVGKDELTRVWEHFERFSLYDDLKSLHAKVLPEIAKFEQRIIQFKLDQEKNQMIIRQFDAGLSTKSSKIAVEELEKFANESFAKKSENDVFINHAQQTMDKLEIKSQDLISMVEVLNNSIETRIVKEVGLATAHRNESNLEGDVLGDDYAMPSNLLKKIGNSKFFDRFVAKEDMKNQMNGKTNKTDLEMITRQIQIMHKQLKQVVVLIAQKCRQSLEIKGNETQHAKQNRKVNMLHNALLIQNWVSNFDSNNINDCFDEKQNNVPINLEPYERRNKSDLQKLDQMKLSPNRSRLNAFIRGQQDKTTIKHKSPERHASLRSSSNNGVPVSMRTKKSLVSQSVNFTLDNFTDLTLETKRHTERLIMIDSHRTSNNPTQLDMSMVTAPQASLMTPQKVHFETQDQYSLADYKHHPRQLTIDQIITNDQHVMPGKQPYQNKPLLNKKRTPKINTSQKFIFQAARPTQHTVNNSTSAGNRAHSSFVDRIQRANASSKNEDYVNMSDQVLSPIHQKAHNKMTTPSKVPSRHLSGISGKAQIAAKNAASTDKKMSQTMTQMGSLQHSTFTGNFLPALYNSQYE